MSTATTAAAQSNQQTNVWQYKCFLEWVKTVLFAELLDDAARVALLGGASGADTGKLQRAHVDSVTVVDDAEPLAIAQERWRSKGEPFKCVHVTGAPHLAALWRTRVPDVRQFDAVFAFDALDLVPTDESALDAWLAATAALLKPGGRLAGVCADSAQLWSRAQKALIAETTTAAGGAGTGVLSSDLFDLSFALGLDTFPRFGARYVLTLHEGTAIRPDALPAAELHRSLVHFGSLIRLALSHGLHFVEATNFLDFYEEHKRTHHAALKQCGVLAGGKSKIEQADLIGLFTTFVFVKGG
jgi:hypothetical protein